MHCSSRGDAPKKRRVVGVLDVNGRAIYLSRSLVLYMILPCLLPVMVMEMVAIGEETMMIRETVDAAETEIALSLSAFVLLCWSDRQK